MKATIIAAIVLIAAIAGVLLGVKRTSTSTATLPVASNPSPTRTPQDIPNPTDTPVATPTPVENPAPPATAPAEPAPGTVPGQPRAYVEKRISELQDLSAENDNTSLQIILSELSNRNREIRHAAIEAAIQFGSRDAVPVLLEVAAQTDDPAEKAELTEAADYLKLPSLTEVMARQNKTAPKIQPATARNNWTSRKGAPAPPPAPTAPAP